jgi:hypothetical protein
MQLYTLSYIYGIIGKYNSQFTCQLPPKALLIVILLD